MVKGWDYESPTNNNSFSSLFSRNCGGENGQQVVVVFRHQFEEDIMGPWERRIISFIRFFQFVRIFFLALAKMEIT